MMRWMQCACVPYRRPCRRRCRCRCRSLPLWLPWFANIPGLGHSLSSKETLHTAPHAGAAAGSGKADDARKINLP